jgi:uncharacterized protein (DUF2461 family)
MSEAVIPKSCFTFLRKLAKNNDRDWFKAHKAEYEQQVRDPAVELIARLEKPLARAAPMLSVIPKAHNGSLMRI